MAGKTEYKNEWLSKNCDRINITVKKGARDALHEAAKANGESVNSYIKKAVQSRYKAETSKDIEL